MRRDDLPPRSSPPAQDCPVTVSGHVYKINYLTYWTAFWSLLIGLGAALLGGVVGGAFHRRVDEPYLDLQRATARETTAPVVEQRAPLLEQPVPAGVHAVPVTQTPSNVAPVEATDATTPATYEQFP